MDTANSRLAALALGLAVTVFASPSFAQRGQEHISAARAAAIHTCSVRAEQYPINTWNDTELYVYRACMGDHGRRE
jgi:hypothetical protein